MQWSFRSDAPIYSQLVTQIELQIAAGRYPPGMRLPAVRDFAAEAGVNPNTMQRALTELEQKQLVFSQRTAGRYVTQDRERIEEARRSLAQAQLENFLSAMTELGYQSDEIAALIQQKRKDKEVSE